MTSNKRLYRVNEDKVIMGVCTGLAEYFNTDVSIVRLIFILLIVFGAGSPVLIYLILGIVLPVKEIEIKRAETVEEDEYSYNQDDYKM